MVPRPPAAAQASYWRTAEAVTCPDTLSATCRPPSALDESDNVLHRLHCLRGQQRGACGAAGLVFHADGSDKHYGFYPTGGALRLTRFEGPDVLSWKILATEPSQHYQQR